MRPNEAAELVELDGRVVIRLEVCLQLQIERLLEKQVVESSELARKPQRVVVLIVKRHRKKEETVRLLQAHDFRSAVLLEIRHDSTKRPADYKLQQ